MRNAKCVLTPDSGKHRMAGPIGLACLILLIVVSSPVFAQTTCTGLPNGTHNVLLMATSGLTVGGSLPNYTMSLTGSVNGLGVNNTSGATGTSASDGYWYTTSVILHPCNYNANATTATVGVWANQNTQFAACAGTGCPGTTGTKLGTASPGTTIATGLTDGSNTTINIGIFVSNQSGTGFSTTGATSVQLSFLLTTDKGNTGTTTLTINFTNQTAVNLVLSASSVPITSVAFGNVNGLGAGTPSPGLTLLTPACGTPCAINPGVIYSYPYTITPTFSSFTSSTGTVTVQVTSNFTHSGDLVLMDSSAASFSSFSAIGVGSPSTITSAAASATDISRFLGLEVKHVHGTGGTLGTGSDNATLTYTVTSP